MSAVSSRTAPVAGAGAGPSGRWRRQRTWVLIAGGLLVAVLVVVLFGNDSSRREGALDPDNPGPDGAQAVARVLDDQGVDVTIVRSADALAAATIDSDTAVVVTSTERLGRSSVDRLRGDAADAARTVLVEPEQGVLRLFDVRGYPATLDTGDPLGAECSTDEVFDGLFDGLTLEVDGALGYRGAGCFGDSAGSAYVDAGDVELFGAGDALTNDQVLRADNAAVALRLLGQQDRLVWYVASYDDLTGDDGVDFWSLLPDWIQPGLVLVTVTVVLLMLWRGRRLGPLATEPLPVSIKAIETTRSRGRLYRKAGDRAHAAEALRGAAREHAARRLRLGRGTTEEQLIRDVARHVSRSEQEVGWLLATAAPAPTSDRDLIRLAKDLAALEEEVRRS